MGKGLIRGLAIAATLGAGCLAAAAQTAPDAPRAWLGAWDLTLDGAPRRCTLTFGSEKTGAGYELRFPATCRRALPVLGAATAWTLQANGRPRLLDATGKDVVGFGAGSREASLDGKGSDGKTYRLAAKGQLRPAFRSPQDAAAADAEVAQRATVADPAKAPAPETLPGRYVLMRQQDREACRLVLSAPPAAGQPGGTAFEGRCQDTGLTIFDPVGWRYAGGRLSLVARRGHSTDLVFENGRWRKDPATGAPLLMRKLAP